MRTRQIVFPLLLIVVLFITGCTRSASKAPTAIPANVTSPATGAGGNGTTSAESPSGPDVMATALAAGQMTQTALAQIGEGIGGGGDQPTATPTPPADQSAPTSAPPLTVQPPTATPAPIVEPSVPETYTLHNGEFPYCLARRFNIAPDALLNANSLTRGSTTYPGQSLTIPQNAAAFTEARALHAHPTSYTIQANDTLYIVACYFGDVSPEAIAQANGLAVDAALTSGQTLQIP